MFNRSFSRRLDQEDDVSKFLGVGFGSTGDEYGTSGKTSPAVVAGIGAVILAGGIAAMVAAPPVGSRAGGENPMMIGGMLGTLVGVSTLGAAGYMAYKED